MQPSLLTAMMRQKPKPGTPVTDPHGLHESHHTLQSFGGSRVLAVFAILVIYTCMSTCLHSAASSPPATPCPASICFLPITVPRSSSSASPFSTPPPALNSRPSLPPTLPSRPPSPLGSTPSLTSHSTPILSVAVLGPSSPLIILALLFFQPFGSTASFAAAAFFLLFIAYPFLVDVQPSPTFARFLLCASAWFKKGPTLWLEQGLVEEIEARPVNGSMWCYHPHGTGVGFGFLINVRGQGRRRLCCRRRRAFC